MNGKKIKKTKAKIDHDVKNKIVNQASEFFLRLMDLHSSKRKTSRNTKEAYIRQRGKRQGTQRKPKLLNPFYWM